MNRLTIYRITAYIEVKDLELYLAKKTQSVRYKVIFHYI